MHNDEVSYLRSGGRGHGDLLLRPHSFFFARCVHRHTDGDLESDGHHLGDSSGYLGSVGHLHDGDYCDEQQRPTAFCFFSRREKGDGAVTLS